MLSVLVGCPTKRLCKQREAPPASFCPFCSSSGACEVYTEDAPVIRMLQTLGRMAVAEGKLVVSRAREQCCQCGGGLGVLWEHWVPSKVLVFDLRQGLRGKREQANQEGYKECCQASRAAK